jgi:hypothetical protein
MRTRTAPAAFTVLTISLLAMFTGPSDGGREEFLPEGRMDRTFTLIASR